VRGVSQGTSLARVKFVELEWRKARELGTGTIKEHFVCADW